MLAPENIEIPPDMYSPYMETNFPKDTSRKLTPNHNEKPMYTLHYRNLQLYLELGMEVEKVHCALQFKQSRW